MKVISNTYCLKTEADELQLPFIKVTDYLIKQKKTKPKKAFEFILKKLLEALVFHTPLIIEEN